MLEVAYLRALRDALVEEDEIGVHPLLTESGWTTFHITAEADYEHARWLLRLSYLPHVRTLGRTPSVGRSSRTWISKRNSGRWA